MTALPIQLRKEVRQIFWPWLLLILGGLLSLVHISPTQDLWSPVSYLLEWLPAIGCFLGIPVLATLPIGSEFQHGTLASLLAQPVDRNQLWMQKTAVSLIPMIPVALLFLVSGRFDPAFMPDFWMAITWMIATAAGAMVGALIAKSTMGGYALSSGIYWILFYSWSYLAERQRLVNGGALSNFFLLASALALLFYSVCMILLGRRLFIRFQPVEGTLADDALSPLARLLPRVKANWLRPHPRRLILNLIFKEIWLLKIVWFLSLLSLASWIFLAVFRFAPGRSEVINFYTSDIPVLLAVLLCFLITVLAGSISLGEEKTIGTQAWHLTLPLSASLQWLIKLLVALAVCFICALGVVFIVMLVRAWLSGAPHFYFDRTPLWFWIFYAVLSTLLAFWCTCHVKGTVRAVLCFFPLVFLMGLAMASGSNMGFHAVQNSKTTLDWFLSRFDPFADDRIFTIVLSPADGIAPFLVLGIAPLIIVALIQSLRAFVSPYDERKLPIARSAIPLLAILFLSTTLLSAIDRLASELRKEQMDFARETHPAIEAFLGSGNPDIAVQRFNLSDLAKVSPFSERTKYWLKDATIV